MYPTPKNVYQQTRQIDFLVILHDERRAAKTR